MPKVTYLAQDGTHTDLDIPEGHSLMEAAIAAGIPGIVAECRGSMMCATCHVYADPERLDDLPPMGPTEDAMLDSVVCERRENSRLSCQLVVTAKFDGLMVTMPERQT